jgi:hypothetical protein
MRVPAGSRNPEDYHHFSDFFLRFNVDRVLSLDTMSCATALSVLCRPAEIPLRKVAREALGSCVGEILETLKSDEFCNVGIVSPADLLPLIIQVRLGLPNSAAASLVLNRRGISIVHYPGTGVAPVLQGMNLFEAGLN